MIPWCRRTQKIGSSSWMECEKGLGIARFSTIIAQLTFATAGKLASKNIHFFLETGTMKKGNHPSSIPSHSLNPSLNILASDWLTRSLVHMLNRDTLQSGKVYFANGGSDL